MSSRSRPVILSKLEQEKELFLQRRHQTRIEIQIPDGEHVLPRQTGVPVTPEHDPRQAKTPETPPETLDPLRSDVLEVLRDMIPQRLAAPADDRLAAQIRMLEDEVQRARR
jgi:hypothetical protein